MIKMDDFRTYSLLSFRKTIKIKLKAQQNNKNDHRAWEQKAITKDQNYILKM